MEINYEKVLEDLRRRRQQLDGAIAAIEQIVLGKGATLAGGGDVNPPAHREQSSTKIMSDTFFGMQTPDAVKKYLGMVKRPQTAADIAKALEKGGILSQAKNFYANISTVVRRLEARGELVQLPDSKEWAIASWYPNKVKPRKNGKDESEEDDEGGEGTTEVGNPGLKAV